MFTYTWARTNDLETTSNRKEGTMTNTINYTHEFEALDSELVYDVWYDERDRKAYVNLHDNIYAYSGVSLDDVLTMVNADSIGRAYNGSLMQKGFKRKFGLVENLGPEFNLNIVERDLVTAAPGVVPKNLTYAEDAKVDGLAPAKTVPLRPVPTNTANAPAAAKRTMTVHFESNGSKTYRTEAATIDEAVAALDEIAEMLGVRLDVTGVFVHLG